MGKKLQTKINKSSEKAKTIVILADGEIRPSSRAFDIINKIQTEAQNIFGEYKKNASNDLLKIKQLIEIGDHQKAFELYKEHSIFINDFNLLNSIDDQKLASNEDKVDLWINKFELKEHLKDWEYLKREIPKFLSAFKEYLQKDMQNELLFAIAYANKNLGNINTSIYKFYELLKNKDITPNLLGRIYGNLGELENNFKYFELSTDLALSSGDTKNAINTKMWLSDLIWQSNPDKALTLIDSAIDLCSENSIDENRLKAKALFFKAKYLMQIKQYAEALTSVELSINMLRKYFGNDVNESRFSYYNLLLNISKNLKAKDKIAKYKKLVKEAKKDVSDTEFLNQLKSADYFEKNDYNKLIEMKKNNPENIVILFSVSIILSLNKDIPMDERLESLDELKKRIDSQFFDSINKSSLYESYARLYFEKELFDKAIENFSKALEFNPANHSARQSYVNLLQNLNKWEEINIFCKKQIDMFGEIPNLMFFYGKSFYELNRSDADLSEALFILNSIKDICALKDLCKSMIDDLINRKIIPAQKTNDKKSNNAFLTLNDFDKSLDDFALYIQQKGRMRFWRNDNGKYKYEKKPETLAKTAFLDFFNGEYGINADFISELSAGAGYIDICINFSNNLKIIIELKMCGGTYSSNYALEGKQQLQHYAKNTRTRICYLIVFDGQKNKKIINKSEIYTEDNKTYTIKTKIIDIYPRTKN